MALASLLGWLALANAGLGAAHGFASVIGGMYPAPHGAVCAAFLPHVMAANLRALRQRQPNANALARYREVAALLTGDPAASAEEGIRWVAELAHALQIPGLAAYGVTRNDFALLIEKTAVASSTKANPIVLTSNELREILDAAL